jgi:hypothetical protein
MHDGSKSDVTKYDFSMLVYKCPGKHDCGSGLTYDHLHVTSRNAFDEALLKGWSENVPEAIKKFKTLATVTVPVSTSEFEAVKKPHLPTRK